MKQITSIILTALMAFAFVGCTDEPLIDNIYPTLELDESDIIETQLTVSVTDFSITATATRADDDPDNEVPSGATETMSDFEKTIDNIWVFQYDTSGDILITPRYYTAAESYRSDGTWDVELEPVRSTIYVVTNTNDELWVTTSTLNNFAKIDNLLIETISTPRFISDMSDTSDEGHIPMQGHVEGVTPSDNGSDIIVVPVEHMYAKVKMRFVIDDLLAQYDAVKVTNVSFSNIPYYCRVETLYGGTRASMDNSYPSDCWNSRYINTANNTDDPNNEGLDNTYDYVIYVPENIQGESDEAGEKKAPDASIKHPSSITAYISYIDDDGAQRAASYTMYPGGNNYNNYNIRRNQVYRITMNIAYPEEIVRQPSANCLFGFAGETIAFYPYYRVETGGYEDDADNHYTNYYQNEYHFENYLYPTPGDASGYTGQKIGGLKIIWQTAGCIGDNTNGDLVYLVSTTGDDTHDGYEQIYVKTAKEGNALIAAYADAACTGDILWSWHIWVRERQYGDPTDLGNAYPYYTYDWNGTGIYSYKYYTDRNETPVRIPGYQIMSCNIGALQDEPNYGNNQFFGYHYSSATGYQYNIQYFEDGDGIVRTFGMMYQWGRKDPFPPLTTTLGGISNSSSEAYNSGYYIHDYNDAHTQTLYGNDGKKEVHKTSYGTESYLFHSHIAGTDEGMAYTIKHPTVFMCGTNAIAQTLTYALDGTSSTADKTDYVKSLSNYKYKGGWSEEDEFDNNEWGGLDISQSNKSFNLGFTDEEGYYIYLYEDYGTKKTIFDPCPYGWRVSSGDLWLGFTQNGVNALDDYTKQNTYTNNNGTITNTGASDSDGSYDYINYDPDKSCLLGMTLYLGSSWRSGHTTWFPAQGFLMPDGCGYRVGACGNYVNANANSDYGTYDRVYITHLHDRISTIRVFEHQLHYTVKSAANPLRCVRDTK